MWVLMIDLSRLCDSCGKCIGGGFSFMLEYTTLMVIIFAVVILATIGVLQFASAIFQEKNRIDKRPERLGTSGL